MDSGPGPLSNNSSTSCLSWKAASLFSPSICDPCAGKRNAYGQGWISRPPLHLAVPEPTCLWTLTGYAGWTQAVESDVSSVTSAWNEFNSQYIYLFIQFIFKNNNCQPRGVMHPKKQKAYMHAISTQLVYHQCLMCIFDVNNSTPLKIEKLQQNGTGHMFNLFFLSSWLLFILPSFSCFFCWVFLHMFNLFFRSPLLFFIFSSLS